MAEKPSNEDKMVKDDCLEISLVPKSSSSAESSLHGSTSLSAPPQILSVEVPLEHRSSNQDSLHGLTQHVIDVSSLLPIFATLSTQERPHAAATVVPRPPPGQLLAQAVPLRSVGKAKSESIEPPYPWATNRRAIVHDIEWLKSKGIFSITGSVQCKHCEKEFEIQYDLKKKFGEITFFIYTKKQDMCYRAAREWLNPVFPDCQYCEKKRCVKPVMGKKREINWLFLLLGQMLGYCRLSELKYFCKHNRIHRTGAKDRLLYLTYIGLCKQLKPNGPYDV